MEPQPVVKVEVVDSSSNSANGLQTRVRTPIRSMAMNMDCFIDLFQAEACLWDSKSPVYHNRTARAAAIARIARSLGLPAVAETEKTIKDKIKHLRTSFAKELRDRQRTEKTSNAGTAASVHPPKWKWFGKMQFLLPHVVIRPNKNNPSDGGDAEKTSASRNVSPSLFEDWQPESTIANTSAGNFSGKKSTCTARDEDVSIITFEADLSDEDLSSISAEEEVEEEGEEDPQDVQVEPDPEAVEMDILSERRAGRKRPRQSSLTTSRHYHFSMDLCQQLDSMPYHRAMAVRQLISQILYQNIQE